MPLNSTQELYNKFKNRSGSKLGYEQFNTLLIFFPAILVVMSDGVIDDEEWVYVDYLSKFMAKNHKDNLAGDQAYDELVAMYYEDLQFLIENLSTWKNSFLEELKSVLIGQDEIKSTLVETLYLFADASEGVSDDEQHTIDNLKELLDLQEEDD
jgi:hypothetical protein